jgi:ribosome biogenesis GTPase A
MAFIGSVNDEILQLEELSLKLIEFLCERYSGVLKERYDVDESMESVKILESIAVNRNCLAKGNEVSYAKAAAILMDEFRSGRLGRITLESPDEVTEK